MLRPFHTRTLLIGYLHVYRQVYYKRVKIGHPFSQLPNEWTVQTGLGIGIGKGPNSFNLESIVPCFLQNLMLVQFIPIILKEFQITFKVS